MGASSISNGTHSRGTRNLSLVSSHILYFMEFNIN